MQNDHRLFVADCVNISSSETDPSKWQRLVAMRFQRDEGVASPEFNDSVALRTPVWPLAACVRLAFQPILKLPLTRKTALTIAKAMKPTSTNTSNSTPLAITLVKTFS
jgi:hypothetical protein